MRGFLFFISSPWYRSAWKYRERAYRYCLLDAGHLLGAVEAGSYLYRHAYRVAYDIDLAGLNRFFGFGEEEFFLSAAIAAVPIASGEVEIPKKGLRQVDPTGVFAHMPLIEEAYRETIPLAGCKKEPGFPRLSFHESAWEDAILKRRSAREFAAAGMTKAQYEAIVEFARQPIPGDCDEPVGLHAVLNRVGDMPIGIYNDGKLAAAGDFAKKTAYLCLEQGFVEKSAVTFFLLSGDRNYRALMQKAGIVGHRIYLISEYLGLGCSGIGAFYDDEAKRFFDDDRMVLYALAVGPK